MDGNRGPGYLITRDGCVLAVIDMQGRLFKVMSDRERVLENNVKLARFAGIVGIPVVVTEQENLGPTMEEISSEVDGFDPVSKIEFDACRRDEFLGRLESSGAETVVVTGIESHICVTQTVLSLLPEYNVHVVGDAVASRFPENRLIALERMRAAGAVVTSTEMFMYEILVEAGTDEFREALKLVK